MIQAASLTISPDIDNVADFLARTKLYIKALLTPGRFLRAVALDRS